ncbi:outer membrane beta-barrel protein [Bradyrhizobium diazoefficiens]|uniref:outer membrane beta-barrel protein n=1 Tax=Bradyrhizobium diazoefficiens TaxID=1355477 RepID=UPI00190DB3DD|nr:outer membrane beta-barrel protein [Bradyrhizobium diazoefficiens]QQO35118.1 outer membrane beta-barrel protein [Bradyrhizobium diazoefficiens]
MGSPPGRGRSSRAYVFRAALPCLLLTALESGPVAAQSLTPDLFNPNRGGFAAPDTLPTRRTAGVPQAPSDALPAPPDPNDDRRKKSDAPAPSRVGQIPTYGLPAANGASGSGYDSLNRKRQQPKLYPGQPKPKKPAGPGSPVPSATPTLSPLGAPRIAPPPSETANKTPVPPAMAGTVPGQPQRRRLKADDDAFGAVGDYAGSFLIKGGLELSTGYDTNPARLQKPVGSPVYVVAPDLLVMSDWERHALVADLRGSFSGYTNNMPATIDGLASPSPVEIDRPDFTGHVDGRFDVDRDLKLTSQLRLRLATDNPGSPNVQAGLQKYPVYAAYGGTFGFDQTFNRFQVAAGATIDRTAYTDSKLTDGSTSSNDDRDFNQYGGVGRFSYELKPGLKPFVEIEGDNRVHDQPADRNGYLRDSSGGYAKVGSSFEFSRILTGEISVGYSARNYVDPRLSQLSGFLTSGSLIWNASGLTTVKFNTDTQIAETTIPGSSGVLVHIYAAEVDHDFRRWLTAIGKFTYGTYDYQGQNRNDKTYSLEGNLIYKLNRNIWIKGTLRHDILDSNQPGSSSQGTVMMVGVRLQN